MRIKSAFPGQENWSWCWDDDRQGLAELLEDLEAAPVVAFDTETTGLDPTMARLVAMSFAGRNGKELWAKTVCISRDQPEDNEEWWALMAWLDDPTEYKILANAKYDINVMRFNGYDLQGVAWDTMIADQVLYDHEEKHSIDACSVRYLDLPKIPTSAVFDEKVGWGPVPKEELALYANEDVVAALCIAEAQQDEADAEHLYDTITLEMRVLPLVAEMEYYGTRIDVDRLDELTREFTVIRDAAQAACDGEAEEARAKLLAKKEKAFAEIDARWQSFGGPKDRPKALDKARSRARAAVKAAAQPLNLNSGPQLVELLYDEWQLHRKLGLRHPPKTKKGNPAADKDTLPKLAPYSRFVQELLTWREVAKLIGTYTEKLPGMLSLRTDRLHCSFKQCGAGTGRFTCSDPNLQNIPNRTELGRKLRECFIPDDGYVLVAADYSQIEPRLVAHLSQEPVWLDAFLTGKDLYKATAAAIWGCAVDEVTADQRGKAKTVTLAMLYGAGPARVMNEAKVSFDEACALIDAFWAALPTLRTWLDKQPALCRAQGKVAYTPWGRRRHLPDIDHRWSGPRRAAERQAGNHPVQGGAADILKMAMAQLADRRHLRRPEDPAPDLWRPLIQVHDELLFEVRTVAAEAFKTWVCELMEGVVELTVPLKVEAAIGANWGEAH